MERLSRLKSEIKSLSHQEYVELRRWFTARDWQEWDAQIEQDSDAGKLDFLIEEAEQESVEDRLRDL